MTVQELIDQLSELDSSLEVRVESGDTPIAYVNEDDGAVYLVLESDE